MFKVMAALTIAFQFFFFQAMAFAAEAPYNIYIDADFSNHTESSESIERGFKVALKNVDFKVMSRSVNIIRKDHRGNSARSQRHINQYLKDPNALLMISGIHSPPLLAHLKQINKQGVLFLVPWAAAGPITRYPSDTNWVFRLSIDDSKAGKVISHYAIKKKKNTKKPHLLLENTGWGKSNEKTMSNALQELGISKFKVDWFDWSLKRTGAKSLINKIVKEKSDVVFLVSNSLEGAVIVKELASLAEKDRLPVLSHWGIIGGNFHKVVLNDMREKVELKFLQTKFSFINKELTDYQANVFEQAKKMFPEIKSPMDILAPTGFIHAHDLGLLFIAASKNVRANQSIQKTRGSLRDALEQIKKPIQGLIKMYRQPFSNDSKTNRDAHEALNINDFVMASFGTSDEIVLDPWRFK